ncbi:MAG: peptidase S8, partial [Erythrobacter sp.]
RRARGAAQVQRLSGAVERPGFTRAAGGESLSLALSTGETTRAAGLQWPGELRLAPEEAAGPRVLAARVAGRIAPDLQAGFAFGMGARTLSRQLQRAGTDSAKGAPRAAFRIAPEAGLDEGFTGSSDLALAARRGFGEWGVTLSAQRGRAWLAEHRRAEETIFGLAEHRGTTTLSLAVDRAVGDVEARLGASWLVEEETLLGAHFHRAFTISGADSLFLDGALAARIAPGWTIAGAVRGGITRPRGGDAVGEGSHLLTQGWSLDLTKAGVLGPSDRLGLRFSQPLRVEGGTLDFDLPVAWDYASESAVMARRSVSLAPQGREVMGELAWSRPFALGHGPWGARAWGSLSTSVYYRRQPGHFADAPADMGALVSVTAGF